MLYSLSVSLPSAGDLHSRLSTVAQSDQSGLTLRESLPVLNMQMPTLQFMKYLPT